MERDALKDTSRVVVKFGTGILTNRSKQIDPRQIEQLVGQVAAQREAGREVMSCPPARWVPAWVC